MKVYTIEEQNELGVKLAKALGITEHKEAVKARYQTGLGDKTAIGVFNMVLSLAEAIQNGTIKDKLQDY